jgi:DNA polymerase
MIDAAQRAQYLAALGIDVWVPRQPTSAATIAADPAPVSIQSGTPASATAAPLPQHTAVGVDTLDWTDLRAAVAQCQLCGLAATRTQTVFGVGDTAARWLVIGEAPGAEEDRRGEPFVGAAGQLLDKMLLAIDLPRASVFIANMLKCRPPANRDPKPEELNCCRPYLLRQIALLKPAIILVVGRIAAQNLLATDLPLARLRGKIHHCGPLNTPVIVTYHPAYLLRTPGDKRKAWEDLKFARQTYQQLNAAHE